MSNNSTYEHNARHISDLKDRLTILKQQFANLETQHERYRAANNFLKSLERQIANSNQKDAWLEFLKNIDLRDRYEEIRSRTTTGY